MEETRQPLHKAILSDEAALARCDLPVNCGLSAAPGLYVISCKVDEAGLLETALALLAYEAALERFVTWDLEFPPEIKNREFFRRRYKVRGMGRGIGLG